MTCTAAALADADVGGPCEHYGTSAPGWSDHLEASVDQLTDLVDEEVVRAWRSYLAAGAAAFRDGRMGVDQILAARPGAPRTLPAVRGS